MRRAKAFSAGILFFTALAFAADEIDAEIVKNLEFYEQMEVIQNLDLAKNYDVVQTVKTDTTNAGATQHENK